MFIYRVWALFIVASVSAASSSSRPKMPTSVAGTSGSTSAKVERRTLQHMASQPLCMTSPILPDGPFDSASARRVAAMYSASAPARPAKPWAITSPGRLDDAGFNFVPSDDEASELSASKKQSFLPHLLSANKSRIDELLQETPDTPSQLSSSISMQSLHAELDSVTAAGSDEDYFEVPLYSESDDGFILT